MKKISRTIECLLLILGVALAGCGLGETLPAPPAPPPAGPNPTTPTTPPAASSPSNLPSLLNCQQCHGDVHADWLAGPHALTQTDVADELAEERVAETPDEVLHGADPEDCIACHGPTAILANSGMSEVDTLSFFFTRTDGAFSADTSAVNTDDWPNVGCTACHNVPADHPATLPTLALYNSVAGKYAQMDNTSALCGQCHGDLRFADTDHLTYNAWAMSRHSVTQADVADELAAERDGQTPDEVLNGDDPENCIACHAPTAVITNGRMSEEQALNYFFTTTDGHFSASTTPVHGDEWPDVACNACHDPMNPGTFSYFNSSTKKHEPMASSSELCGQCHGNLRFPDTDHLSYNVIAGTGGMGIPDLHTMPGATCTDCHMFVSDVDGSNSSMFHGHTFAISVQEDGGQATLSCIKCHPNTFNTTDAVDFIINLWRQNFEDLDATAQTNVADAEAALVGVNDPALQAKLQEAQFNLGFAESDESGGFHNHVYLMALLNDANGKALDILTALGGP